eukprot:CAMPEP_0115160274 /NCGR_PEP_ID=MMETSP0227-20121206/70707_1 /TAXON_ID=89957 /ORGANISM="Polarella glacialis, Strain CCMP 1383" /LENGTH=70 /DNA_ID=CAMNT_0002572139 /DNA_START=380 /DNA_END=588 /DNA_ORIENTATION=+
MTNSRVITPSVPKIAGKLRMASSVALAVLSKRAMASRYGHVDVSKRIGFTKSFISSTMFMAMPEYLCQSS